MQLNYAPYSSSASADPVITKRTPIVKLIPGWVFRAIVRNKLTATDIGSYSKIRAILSVNDIAELLWLNSSYKIEGACLGKDLELRNMWWYSEFFENLSKEEKLEIQNSVVPLSYSEEIAESVKMRLKASNDVSDCDYKMITTADCIYLVLNEGFDTSMQDSSKLMDFVQKYLQTCYSTYPVAEVSTMPVYELYLHKLSVQG